MIIGDSYVVTMHSCSRGLCFFFTDRQSQSDRHGIEQSHYGVSLNLPQSCDRSRYVGFRLCT